MENYGFYGHLYVFVCICACEGQVTSGKIIYLKLEAEHKLLLDAQENSIALLQTNVFL